MEDGRAIRLWTATGLVINAEVCMLNESDINQQMKMSVDANAEISEISLSEIYLYCKVGVHSRIQLPIGCPDFRIQASQPLPWLAANRFASTVHVHQT